MTELLETGFSAAEYRIKHSNGSWVNRYSRSTLLTNENQQPFAILSIIRDITVQKKTEEQLREAEEKHRTLLNSANVLVQSVDSEGKYLFVNEEWKKVLGYTEKDMAKITIMDVVRKDHLPYCMDVFKQVMAGLSIHDVETVFVTKDGRELTVSGNACPIFKDGKFVSTVAFFEDVTERKKNEEKIKENNRRIELMNEKLRVVGSLTRHDVRNKLSTITGYSYILKKKHPDQADVVDGLDKMVQAVKDSLKIFDFAKAYEQIGIEKLVYIDVEKAINEAAEMFSGLTFKVVNDCHGLTVRADSLLRQLVYNFIDNTRKYGQKTTFAKIHYKKISSGDLELIYEDDGVGIPFDDKQQLFKQGFSTGGSTGFGLFLVKKMIEVYGWTVNEEGKPGEGAKFKITIPKNDGEIHFSIFQDLTVSKSNPEFLLADTLQAKKLTR
jgi:PAS domain S-box-containing protein